MEDYYFILFSYFSLLEFSCSLCDFKADWGNLCINHMKKEHSGWKDQIQGETGMKSILCL